MSSQTLHETDPHRLLANFFHRPHDLEVLRVSGSDLKNRRHIPKVIHQIWLGSPLPSRLAKLRETWMKNHPDWQFRLWTDDDFAQGSFESLDLADSTTCFGQKSDLLRAEVIYRYGGVYVDLDYESFRPLDLNGSGAMFATLRWIPQANLGWPQVFTQPLIICNSLFGAEAGCVVLRDYLKLTRDMWNDHPKLDFASSDLDRISIALMGGETRVQRLRETALRTYLPFHQTVWKAASSVEFIPPVVFNPVIQGWQGLYAMPQFWKMWRDSNSAIPRWWIYSGVDSRTIARHWSTASWLA